MKEAIKKTIIQFKKWYVFSILIYAVLLPPVFFLLVVAFGYKTEILLSLSVQIILSLALTLLTLVLNHLMHQRTYLTWLRDMQACVDDIENAGA